MAVVAEWHGTGKVLTSRWLRSRSVGKSHKEKGIGPELEVIVADYIPRGLLPATMPSFMTAHSSGNLSMAEFIDEVSASVL